MRKPAGYKNDSTGMQWYKNFASLAAALRAKDSLLNRGYRANVNNIGGKYRVVVSKDDPYSSNSGRRRMTKAQRRAKAKRTGAKRRKLNAVKQFLKRMNPGHKMPAAVRVKRLKGGGYSITPVKVKRAK